MAALADAFGSRNRAHPNDPAAATDELDLQPKFHLFLPAVFLRGWDVTTYLPRFNDDLRNQRTRTKFGICSCLPASTGVTWSSAADLDPTLPLENFTGTATNKVLNKPPENIDVDLATGYEAVALPLAPFVHSNWKKHFRLKAFLHD